MLADPRTDHDTHDPARTNPAIATITRKGYGIMDFPLRYTRGGYLDGA